MRLALIIICSIVMTGCMGVTSLSGYTDHVDGCSNGSVAVGIGSHKYKLSKTDMETLYGKPEKIVTEENNIEQWYYPNGLKWRGVIVSVIVPIPLILPVGKDFHIVNFSNGWCESEDFQIDQDVQHGFRCGYLGYHGSMMLQCGTN